MAWNQQLGWHKIQSIAENCWEERSMDFFVMVLFNFVFYFLGD